MQLNNVSKELLEIKDSSSVLRRRLAEMMNSLLSDLVSVNVVNSVSTSVLNLATFGGWICAELSRLVVSS